MSAIVGIIPARWASSRFPGKALFPVAGVPLVIRVCRRAAMASSLSRLLVATDDKRISAAVSDAGFEAVMTDGEYVSGTDRIAAVAAGLRCEVVVNIQGDEPLIDPELIDRLGLLLENEAEWDMSTAAAPITEYETFRRPSVVKVVADANGRALYFSRAPIPYERSADGQSTEYSWRHIGVYAYRAPFLKKLVSSPPSLLERLESLEQLRALEMGGLIKVLPVEDAAPGVDTPEDIQRVEKALTAPDTK